MNFALYYQLTIRDAQGRVLRRTRRRRARSYVKAWAQLLSNWMKGSQSLLETIKDTGGTDRNPTNTVNQILASGPVNNANYGPVVGTGTTAVALADYALATQIAEGTGAGQLTHQATSHTAVAVTGSTATWKLTRVFINSSGGSITINEVGLYTISHDGTANRYFCVIRDLYAGGLAVPDGGSATLEWSLSITA